MICQMENFSHHEVFGHLNEEHFSVKDAAAYLEISLPTLRRYVSAEKIKPMKVIGRSPLFSAKDLRQLKQKNSVKYANTR